VSLYDLDTGRQVEMTSGYDEMNETSYPDYEGGTEEQRRQRDLLIKTMENHGFTVYEYEWWHFDYDGWEEYRILDIPFSEID
jgi:D-alanyl-D-alanine dipeptidase